MRPELGLEKTNVKEGSREKALLKVLLILAGASLLLVLGQICFFLHNKSELVSSTKEQAHYEAVMAADEIDHELKILMDATQNTANKLGSGELNKEQIKSELKRVMEENPKIFGMGVAFAPYAFNPEARLYGPYCVRADGQLQVVQEEEFRDYPETDWYKSAAANGPGWIEPYYSQASNQIVAKYTVPFYKTSPGNNEKSLMGRVYINHSLDFIKDTMSSLKLGENGYGMLLSKKGTFIYHPVEEYDRGQKTIFDLAEELNISALKTLGEKATSGKDDFLQYKNEVTGQTSWAFVEPVPAAGWSVETVFLMDELYANTNAFRHQLIWLVLGVILLALFFSIILCRAYTGTDNYLWKTVILFSFVLIAGIGSIWYISVAYHESVENKIMVEKSAVDDFIEEQTKIAETLHEPRPIFIPTGVYIQSLDMLKSNDVQLTGYIWQKYNADIPKEISRGFILPEAVSEMGKVVESYHRREGNTEIIGWNFNMTLRQDFSYSQYPLDRKDVWVRIWHQDFDKNVILVPDIGSYRLINPKTLPGVEKDIVLSGFEVESSFFSYVNHNYNTNFGINKYIGQKDFPELYFTVMLKRDFREAFISDILPVIVIACILFAILFMITKNEKRSKVAEFKLPSVLGSCSALFFSVLLAHIKLRGDFPVREVLYLEYFYIAMYFAILFTIINSFLFGSDTGLRFVHHRDNLIPKLLYWPGILLILLVITVFTFY